MKVVIEDGVAKVYETKLICSMSEQELSNKLSKLAELDTGFLPVGTVRKEHKGQYVYYTICTEAGLKGDGVKHPRMIFKLKTKGDSIFNMWVAYIGGEYPSEDMTLRRTSHSNVYKDGRVCMGAAFTTPSGAKLNAKINSIVGRYFTAKKNKDLDYSHAIPNRPNKVTEFGGFKEGLDISGDITIFREMNHKLGDWK